MRLGGNSSTRQLDDLPVVFLSIAALRTPKASLEIDQPRVLRPTPGEQGCGDRAVISALGARDLDDVPFAQVAQANRVPRAKHYVL